MNDSRTVESDAKTGDGLTVRISTGSRLHFGLLDTVRPFGGVGVMTEDPATQVIVSPADEFNCPEHFWSRIGPIAERIRQRLGQTELPACRVDVVSTAPSHCGLGSGTQLALAVAESICRHQELHVDQLTIANELATRGRRSVVGTHGYWQGGLIYESGREVAGTGLNSVHTCVSLPAQWRAAVLRPTDHEVSVSGEQEREEFAKLLPASEESGSELRRLICEEIMPAAKQADFRRFSISTRNYNELSGQLFASVQGGPYNGPAVTRVIQWLRDFGVLGYGQSSWGPGVFAWFDSQADADRCIAALPQNIELLTLTSARNEPRSIVAS
jgi:beta-RFAP synthase